MSATTDKVRKCTRRGSQAARGARRVNEQGIRQRGQKRPPQCERARLEALPEELLLRVL